MGNQIEQVKKLSSNVISILEILEPSNDDGLWLALGRVHAALESYAKVHNHSLNPLTGSNLLDSTSSLI
jgi:hypothetical protein